MANTWYHDVVKALPRRGDADKYKKIWKLTLRIDLTFQFVFYNNKPQSCDFKSLEGGRMAIKMIWSEDMNDSRADSWQESFDLLFLSRLVFQLCSFCFYFLNLGIKTFCFAFKIRWIMRFFIRLEGMGGMFPSFFVGHTTISLTSFPSPKTQGMGGKLPSLFFYFF